MGPFAAENQDVSLFLGEDLIVYLVLAFGAALVAGNLAAIFRPPADGDGGRRRSGRRGDGGERLERAPMGRSLAMAAIGLIAAVWALLSLLNG